jgi:hypothetical protein
MDDRPSPPPFTVQDFLTCYGEAVDVVAGDEPELIAYVGEHPPD